LSGNNFHKVLKKNKLIKFNQNILIFGFFLIISFLFWFFNSLSNEYDTELTIPIEYTHISDNKLVPDAQSNELKVKITAIGYKIVNYKTSSFDSVIVDLNRFKPKLVLGLTNRKYYILTQRVKEQLVNSLGSEVKLNVITPDTLFFVVDELISKKLPVRRNFDMVFKKQFLLKNNIVIKPDSITVKGVKSMLDTINELQTAFYKFTDLDGEHNFELGLIKIPGLDYLSKTVNCRIEAEEFTEQNFELPVEVINAPEKIQIKIFPTNAKISANIGFSRYRSIYKDQFRLIVDFKEAGESEVSRLRIKVAKSPDNISAVRIIPQSVEYIIENND